ncbi:thermonuclease family protein [Neobacillus mesonae]|uniref:thermonuclease family protein n=1 Tax=Neobacillus mesonae TaxID=1193713 RepID=UPI00203EA70F|nr:thermonuclease family protein [Neobacillus mesonae]MCM3568907.1 thermonuclease family protein [Neobacillus mesonae]
MQKMLKQPLFILIIVLSFILSACTGNGEVQHSANTEKGSKAAPAAAQPKAEEAQQTTTINEADNVQTSNKRLLPGVIVKNIDGDTVEIKMDNRVEKIRMLCIDTPETHHPRLGVQPFGPEASEYTKKILPVGKKVEIETGIGDGRDKYGRLLAYIYVDGKMFNEMLLEKGLARVAYIYAPNTKYVDEFYSIQKKAQKKGTGIWSIENYVQEDGYHASEAKNNQQTKGHSTNNKGNTFQNNPNDDQESNVECKGKIKGNANSHIYHVPSGDYYDSTKDNIIWFCTEKEAQDAGYRKSKR